MKVNIIGHKNPDTDSIVSSLVLADLLNKKRGMVLLENFEFEAKRPGELNKETKFLLNYFKQKTPSLIKSAENKKVFLVDHGEYEQSVENIEKAEIIGFLDHHRLGGIETDYPIFYRTEPLGSTSTILGKMFLENNLSPTKKQAGLLLAGTLSDTLNLTSPTTTRKDVEMVKILSEISKENPTKLAKKMFEARSDISDMSSEELVEKDFKKFEESGKRFGIGVCETTNPEKIMERKKELLSCLDKIKNKEKLDLIFFVSIDILNNSSELFLFQEKEIKAAEKIFKKRSKNNLIYLPGVVSRKKQLLPPIINFLKK